MYRFTERVTKYKFLNNGLCHKRRVSSNNKIVRVHGTPDYENKNLMYTWGDKKCRSLARIKFRDICVSVWGRAVYYYHSDCTGKEARNNGFPSLRNKRFCHVSAFFTGKRVVFRTRVVDETEFGDRNRTGGDVRDGDG